MCHGYTCRIGHPIHCLLVPSCCAKRFVFFKFICCQILELDCLNGRQLVNVHVLIYTCTSLFSLALCSLDCAQHDTLEWRTIQTQHYFKGNLYCCTCQTVDFKRRFCSGDTNQLGNEGLMAPPEP